ncbi:ABC-2 transporter permease [Caproiciproducens sp. NJN-50]|uniref:ABC-2 transporter permease n=1 Tax=Caproiciproducens sp. NJN-50 TaxID=2507162 RepID=UPI000FFE1124|nr:ABC-2 transporter permease [Caproiciproducens sp. NJN-50]QAT48524.1 ABC-2 transporter permease [Caproiciproducens sp. NJN-50]
MTGLILKDLLYLKQTAKVLISLLVFYLALFTATGSKDSASGILSGVVIMLTIILSSNAFAYDEAAKWRVYELSLPVAKSRIVLARYLITLIFSTALALLSLFLELIVFRGVTMETAAALLASWSLSLLFCAILFPAMYKYGTQKARLLLMAIVLLPVLGLMLLSKANLPVPSESVLLLGIRLIPFLSVAAYFISYWISCRVFARKKEG